ncbi:ArsR family transcriptional regulator, partial [Pseudidiomarina aestuarii]
MKRVIFLCTGNSARSQLAEALLRHQAGHFFEVFSAGSQPHDIDPRTIAALQKFHLPVDGLQSKSIDEFAGQSFDYVITLCDKARQECAQLPQAREV